MHRKYWFPLMMIVLFFSACARFENEPPTPMTGDPSATALPAGSTLPPMNPYAPGKGDESLQQGEVYIDSLVIVMSNSFPPAYSLEVKGTLPTPCHQLRDVADEPTADNQIHVQVYSVFDLDKVCSQALEPFDVTIPLGSYVRGSYTVFVNDKEVGKITP